MNEIERQKIVNTISMSKRAGRLVLGFDMVKDAVTLGRTLYVFVAQDISPKSLKEVQFFCEEYEAQVFRLPVSMDEILMAVSKRAGILAVLDNGLNKKLRTMSAQGQETPKKQ